MDAETLYYRLLDFVNDEIRKEDESVKITDEADDMLADACQEIFKGVEA